MRVSIFGTGYVGCVTAACLAREGHIVTGVDVDPFKVNCINEGRSPFFEPGLEQLVQEMVEAGRLRATTDHANSVQNSDLCLVCVGTPTQSNGSTRLDYVRNAFTDIAKTLSGMDRYYVVALRSTVLPTAFEEELIPLLEKHSGKKVGTDFGFVYNPEFLREGVAIKDFYDAPWTIIGANDARAGDVAEGLYKSLSAPVSRTDPKTAALVKYFSNTFHALKVAFGNEVGTFCRELGVDGGELMDIFCRDSKLNISPRYLKPGFAFGGSCLPKDVKALVAEVNRRGLQTHLIESILPSNDVHLKNCINLVMNTGRRKIGLVGLSFKAGTDDLRESPAVEMAERLIGKGYDVRIYEPSIGPKSLHGANLRFIEQSIPHIWKLLADGLDQLIEDAEVVVVMQQLKEEERPLFGAMNADQICIDLARTLRAEEVGGEYRAMDVPMQEEKLVSVA
jgi:GDP-mannose 6-dehydrogenase